MQKDDYENAFIDTVEAAALLFTTPGSLRTSRVTGLLFGKPTPKFVKRGGKVGYKGKTLCEFNAQFVEQANTAQPQQAAS